nr:patatin family protein [Klebsiella quasipneumoniae]
MGKLRYLVRRRLIEQESRVGQRIPVTLGNIAPLAVKPFRPGKLALVCEGGGQRGIFTAGVLDEFMRAGFNPFDLMLGTSAGAQNLSAYMCNQQGYARKVITRYTTSRQFFDPMRFVRGGNLIDLDWLVEATSQQMPLAMNYAETQFALGKELWMCACRGDDYSASYFSPTPQTWLDLIRASSAIPGFYRSGVLLDGVSYLDGGVSDAIPVQEAARRGAQTIVVIRTVPSQMFYTPEWFKRMERWLGESSLQPLVNLVHHHETTYRAIQQFIEKPPGKLRIFEIYPQRPLRSMALGSRLPALLEDYKTGRQCGRYFLATVGKLLADRPPLLRHAPRVARPSPVVVPPVPVANEAPQATIIAAPQANDASFNHEDLA